MTSSWSESLCDAFSGLLIRLAGDSLRYLFAFFGALVVTLLLTPAVREYARRNGMLDEPNERRINRKPIPRGGGIAIFLAFHLTLLIMAFYNGIGDISTKFTLDWQLHFMLASSLLLVIGFVDDKYGMRPLLKLTGQVVVATLLFFSDVKIEGVIVSFPGWLAYAVTVFWIVGAINAFNLIDGMDGLSAGLSLIASVGLAGSLIFKGQTADTIPFLVLAGACLGFLRYNFHPASVFLGDSGSMFLGLCIATLPLITGSRKELVTSIGVPILAMGIPIFDTILAIWRRTARALLPPNMGSAAQQTRIMQPDNDHLHHRVLRQTLNQRRAALWLYLFATVLVLVGLAGVLLHSYANGFYMLAFLVASTVAVRHMIRVEIWDTGRLLSRKRAPLRQAVLLPLYIGVDVIVLIVAWMTARFFTGLTVGRQAFVYNLPIVVSTVFLVLVLFKIYQRVWSRASIRDYVILTLALLVGTVAACAVMLMINQNFGGCLRFAVVMFVCSFFPVLGIRVLRESIKEIVHTVERIVLDDRSGTDRLIVIGGGVRFSLFLQELVSRAGQNNTVIVGLLDDDVNLHGRIIAGYKVQGGLEKLVDLIESTGAHRVLIACDMTETGKEMVRDAIRNHPIEVSVWQICEERIEIHKEENR
jgi:UDP-GlcNAc:undecaprenyl-phosphate/decaprenyl-phosphate GlcNAc-1-phosphate transferase